MLYNTVHKYMTRDLSVLQEHHLTIKDPLSLLRNQLIPIDRLSTTSLPHYYHLLILLSVINSTYLFVIIDVSTVIYPFCLTKQSYTRPTHKGCGRLLIRLPENAHRSNLEASGASGNPCLWQRGDCGE